ncbi:hypothetical protein [Actinomadura madurae]|uniref:hypothetical protein n=1 Tax=Actinomadura madurae TaxID=1993 RepID=UPI0020D2567A|nr:hypothetical protein [Actinomadura madurae]MCP9969191.1 hypothetical protein [Actinomadura madurae]MCQ0006822.1 hypothetical protein [Actinomadura madurae]
MDGLEAAPEKSNIASADRRVALEASASARMLSGFAAGPETLDAGIRTVPLRSCGFAPTSPSSQRSSRPESAFEQVREWLVQTRGRSATRRTAAWRATPPRARTRTV